MADETEAKAMDGDEVRSRAAASVVTVGARNVLIRALGFAGNIALARLLVPSDFGIVSLGMTVTLLGGMLANAGLGAALVRRERVPSREELAAVFGFQLALTTIALVLVGAVGLAIGGVGPLVALMAVALPIDTARAPSGVMAERDLDFLITARAEVLETIAYNVLSIGLVAAGLGVTGVAIAVIGRAVVGAAVLIATGPVGPLLPRWRWPVVREIWRFGVRFQLVGLVNMGREQGINVIAASVGGLTVLGIWSLAYRVVQSVSLLFEAVWRVSFPAMARLIETGEDQGPLVRRGIGLASVAAGVPAVAIAGSAPALVPVLFGSKWIDVVDVLPWGAAALMVSGPVATSCVGYLYALGRAGAVLRSSLVQAVLWGGTSTILLVVLGRPEAMGIGMLAGSFGTVTSMSRSLRGEMKLDLLRTLCPAQFAVAVGAICGWTVAHTISAPVPAFAASLVVAEGLFIGVCVVIQRERLASLRRIAGRAVGGAVHRVRGGQVSTGAASG